jgi:UTP:GlnB (protein PII) uridylyltransferase
VGGRPVPREVAEPVRLLHRIRNFLHYLTGRDDNVLDSRLGGEIGDHLGLGAEGLNREVRKALSAVLECRGRVGKALGGESPAAESSPRPDPRYTL